jgi:hypothetical protein
MKLPNPFTGRSTAASLQKAIAERDSAEAKLAELHTKRAAVLLDAELTEVEAIDRQIEAAHRTASVLADKILALDARLHAEERAAQEKAYAADVAAIERLLPLREAAAVEAEAAMKALSSAARKFRDVNNSIVAQWPASVQRPSYHLSLRRLGECIRNGFGHPSLIFRQTLQPLPSGDLVKRVCDADDRCRRRS